MRSKLLVSFIVACVIAHCAHANAQLTRLRPNATRLHVVGGVTAPIASFPYYAYISTIVGSTGSSCGGVLVTPTTVITAAHCVLGGSSGKVYIDLSSATSTTNPVVSFNASDVHIHPMYGKIPGSMSFDIAVINLNVAKTFLKAFPPLAVTALSSSTSIVGAQAVVAGYGVNSPVAYGQGSKGAVTPVNMQAAYVEVVDPQLCSMLYGAAFNVSQHVCAGEWTGTTDTCFGDSGSALALKSTAAGQYSVNSVAAIVTYGAGCAMAGSYNVYTMIAPMLPWLQTVVPGMASTTTAVKAAISPAAGANACTHANIRSSAPNSNVTTVSCGANTITGFAVIGFSTMATPCGGIGTPQVMVASGIKTCVASIKKCVWYFLSNMQHALRHS